MPYLGVSGSNFEKLLSYLKSALANLCLIAKFHARIKMPKFGTKNALFSCFWTGT